MIAGPDSPPLSIAASESSRRPAFCFSGPWHLWQFSASTGRTLVSKNFAVAPAESADDNSAAAAETEITVATAHQAGDNLRSASDHPVEVSGKLTRLF